MFFKLLFSVWRSQLVLESAPENGVRYWGELQ
jgi:hypothetical protein